MNCSVSRSWRGVQGLHRTGMICFPTGEFFCFQAKLISSLTHGEVTESGESITMKTERDVSSVTILLHHWSPPLNPPAASYHTYSSVPIAWRRSLTSRKP